MASKLQMRDGPLCWGTNRRTTRSRGTEAAWGKGWGSVLEAQHQRFLGRSIRFSILFRNVQKAEDAPLRLFGS